MTSGGRKKAKVARVEPREDVPSYAGLGVFLTAVVVVGIALLSARGGCARSGTSAYAVGPGTGDDARDVMLETRLVSLSPNERNDLSNALEAFHRAAREPLAPARYVYGRPDARVRATVFADVACDHCRVFLEAAQRLVDAHPKNLRVDLRQFPRDKRCNQTAEHNERPLRCDAANAVVCAEGSRAALPAMIALTRANVAPRGSPRGGHGAPRTLPLSAERLAEVMIPFVERARLLPCMADASTARAVQQDVDEGTRLNAHRLPLVFIDERRVPASEDLLFVLALTDGRGTHPALRHLPAASERP